MRTGLISAVSTVLKKSSSKKLLLVFVGAKSSFVFGSCLICFGRVDYITVLSSFKPISLFKVPDVCFCAFYSSVLKSLTLRNVFGRTTWLPTFLNTVFLIRVDVLRFWGSRISVDLCERSGKLHLLTVTRSEKPCI